MKAGDPPLRCPWDFGDIINGCQNSNTKCSTHSTVGPLGEKTCIEGAECLLIVTVNQQVSPDTSTSPMAAFSRMTTLNPASCGIPGAKVPSLCGRFNCNSQSTCHGSKVHYPGESPEGLDLLKGRFLSPSCRDSDSVGVE